MNLVNLPPQGKQPKARSIEQLPFWIKIIEQEHICLGVRHFDMGRGRGARLNLSNAVVLVVVVLSSSDPKDGHNLYVFLLVIQLAKGERLVH